MRSHGMTAALAAAAMMGVRMASASSRHTYSREDEPALPVSGPEKKKRRSRPIKASEDHPLHGREPENGRERALVREWEQKLRRDRKYAEGALADQDLLELAYILPGDAGSVEAVVVPDFSYFENIKAAPEEELKAKGLGGAKLLVSRLVPESFVRFHDLEIKTLAAYLRDVEEMQDAD